MKKLILITLLFIPGFVFSQSNTLPFPQSSNSQVTTSSSRELDKFCATWSYKYNGETFEVTFMKALVTSNKTSIDILTGSYYYISEGKLVSGNKDAGGKTIAAGQIKFFPETNKDILHFRLEDSAKKTLETGILVYKEGTTPVLIWQLDSPPKKAVKSNGKSVVKREYPILRTFELNKVSL